MQVLYQIADGLVIGLGDFPTAPVDPALAVRTLSPTETAKLAQPGTKTMDAQGVITVTPPAAPPVTRPKSLLELAADFATARTAYSAGTAAVGSANTQWGTASTAPQQAAALRAGMVALQSEMVALAAGVDALAKAVRALANDTVANS